MCPQGKSPIPRALPVTLQSSPAADAFGQCPPWGWLCLSLERKGSLLAEGRFLSDLIVLMLSPFLVAEVSGSDPSSRTRRECDSWNLVVMRARGPFWGQTKLIQSSHSYLQGHCTW